MLLPAKDSVEPEPLDSPAATGTDPSTRDSAPGADPLSANAPSETGVSSPVTVGERGSASTDIDCNGRLPCRAETAEGAISITLTAADGENLSGDGPLRVDIVTEAHTRDTQLSILGTSRVVTGGQVLALDQGELGLPSAPGARDEAHYALIAAVPINGHVSFQGDLIGNAATLDRVVLEFDENDSAFVVNFLNVPRGAENNPPVDCQNTLPCEWSPLSGVATLTLTDAAAGRWNNATRLLVSWTLEAGTPVEVVLSDYGRAIDATGATLEPYGIELDGIESRDGSALTHQLNSGEQVMGRIVPRRAPEPEHAALSRVEIGLSERRSPRIPRWRPVFLNIPLRATD